MNDDEIKDIICSIEFATAADACQYMINPRNYICKETRCMDCIINNANLISKETYQGMVLKLKFEKYLED